MLTENQKILLFYALTAIWTINGGLNNATTNKTKQNKTYPHRIELFLSYE